MKLLNLNNHRQVLSMLFFAGIGLLSVNLSYADSYSRSYSHSYSGNRHNNYRHYRNHRSHEARHYRRHYDQPHHSYYYDNHNYYGDHNYRHHHYPKIKSYTTNYSSSVSYTTYSDHHDIATTIVGGALGGVIANDLSGGDGAATAFGILTGAVIADGLGH